MTPLVYNSQVLLREDGTQWQVARYNVNENYIAMASLSGTVAVEVWALTEVIDVMQSGRIRHVPTVNRSGIPAGPGLADLRRMRFPHADLSVSASDRVRVGGGSDKRSREELLRAGLNRFLRTRTAEFRGHKA